MEIKGIQKVTLLDYPGKVACTVFTGGCNFRCPFCQNSDLVISPALTPTIAGEEIFGFLRKRRGLLDAILHIRRRTAASAGHCRIHNALPRNGLSRET